MASSRFLTNPELHFSLGAQEPRRGFRPLGSFCDIQHLRAKVAPEIRDKWLLCRKPRYVKGRETRARVRLCHGHMSMPGHMVQPTGASQGFSHRTACLDSAACGWQASGKTFLSLFALLRNDSWWHQSDVLGEGWQPRKPTIPMAGSAHG